MVTQVTCIDHGERGDKDGYLRIRYKGRPQSAHRVAYCEARQIPIEYIKGSVIRHTCDNPRCINPLHLLVGTHKDNTTDMIERNRQVILRGTANGAAKLKQVDVLYIRKHYKPHCKVYSGKALAKRYNVTPALISLVVSGKVWGHT